MKRHHKIELAGEELTLSLSFQTSLDIADAVASPAFIVEELTRMVMAQEAGDAPYNPGFRFNERNVVQILAIANKPHENLGFNAIGDLAAQHGFILVFSEALAYLQEMVIGRSTEMEPSEGSSEGN